MILLLAVLLAASPAPTSAPPQIHVSIQNSWTHDITVYELDGDKSCAVFTFGGDKPYNSTLEPGRTIFADAGRGCAVSPVLYIGAPGYVDYDCWLTVHLYARDTDATRVSMGNGPAADCTMTQQGDDYEVIYRRTGDTR